MNVFASLQHFKKGILSVSQWTGREHKEMQHVFLSVLAGAVSTKVLTVVKALIDFIYYAQLPSQTTKTLAALQTSLNIFHANKQVFIELNIHEHFNIPKIHALQHYVDSICHLGSADGYNTESPKQLHIDFAKKVYRASNCHDYTKQMALWLQRQEAIALHCSYLWWLEGQESPAADEEEDDPDSDSDDEKTDMVIVHLPLTKLPTTSYKIAKSPATANVIVGYLQTAHGATNLIPVLSGFFKLHFKSSPVMPGLYDCFNIFNQISVHIPCNHYISNQSRSSHIRAIPAIPPKSHSSGSATMTWLLSSKIHPSMSHLLG
ncbi:hypothetical protein MVEN_01488600 [Mycena venus]|uniref:Uncharacterized protein n=1 Tax=Mycena venus TaxID=2733690 RepID=A0A8H6XVV4_9AGAR|nr:hypothetical protein MVEN_01488600 [Mycena venus]